MMATTVTISSGVANETSSGDACDSDCRIDRLHGTAIHIVGGHATDVRKNQGRQGGECDEAHGSDLIFHGQNDALKEEIFNLFFKRLRASGRALGNKES
jgi:hypothetical protein